MKKRIILSSALVLCFALAGSWLYFRNLNKFKADSTVSTPPHMPTSGGLEDAVGWNSVCKGAGGNTLAGCGTTLTQAENVAKLSAINKEHSLSLTKTIGTLKSVTNQTSDISNLRQKYKISFWLKIDNRTCYSTGCGAYDLRLAFGDSIDWNNASLSNRITADDDVANPATLDLRPKNQGWIYTDKTFTWNNNLDTVSLLIKSDKFIGDISIDSLKIEKVDSFVPDADMEIPINYEKMSVVSKSNSEFITNAAKTTFDQNFLHAIKNNVELAKISAANGNLFENLTITKNGQGFSIYENDKIKLSLAADSTAIFKLKNNFKLKVSGGILPSYKFYRNGLIYIRDSNKDPNTAAALKYGDGIFFTPVYGDIDLTKYETTKDPVSKEDINYASSYLKFWPDDAAVTFSDANWSVEYDALVGDAFILSIFPPKDFDMKQFCTTRVGNTGKAVAMQDDPDIMASVFSDNFSIADRYRDAFDILQNGNYALEDASVLTTRRVALTAPYYLNPADVFVKNKSLFNSKYGLNFGVYVGAGYYYSNQSEDIIGDVARNIENGVDYVYYDGYPRGNLMRTLKTARQTRNLIGNKTYTQHYSGNVWFFGNRASGAIVQTNGNWSMYDASRDGAKFTVPFIEAYADIVRTGENMPFYDSTKEGFSDIHLNHYTGYGISNSIVEVLAEPDLNNNDNGPVSALTQAKRQLGNYAKWRMTAAAPNYFKGEAESKLETLVPGSTTVYRASSINTGLANYDSQKLMEVYDNSEYVNQLNSMCMAFTKNSNSCDINESYLDKDARNDCAPKADKAIASTSKLGNENILTTNKDLANWIIGDKPLFKMHYNFSANPPYDVSGNKLDPSYYGADNNGVTSPTTPYDKNSGKIHFGNVITTTVIPDPKDSSKTITQTDITKKALAGFHGSGESSQNRRLSLPNDFSIFASVKLDENQNSTTRSHAIYSQAKSGGTTGSIFEYGYDSLQRPYVRYENNGTPQICTAKSAKIPKDDSLWHMVGFTYEKGNNGLVKMYLDGTLVSETLGVCNMSIPDESYIYYIGMSQKSFALDGYLKDFFVSDSLLTSEQISTFYANGDPANYLKKLQSDVSSLAIVVDSFKKYNEVIPYMGSRLPYGLLTMSVDKMTVLTGGEATYTLTLVNKTGAVMKNSQVAGNIPSNMILSSIVTAGGTETSSKITWTVPTLAVNESKTFVYKLKVK